MNADQCHADGPSGSRLLSPLAPFVGKNSLFADFQSNRAARLVTLVFEEGFDQFETLGGKNALHDFDLVIQQVRIGDAEFAAYTAETKVAGAEYQRPHASR